MNAAARRQQITMSPYYGLPDFSGLPPVREGAQLDPVSLADLLRNGFVYPPHSIYRDTKVATFGFDPRHDMHGTPEFRFAFPRRGNRSSHGEGENLLQTYDRLLCDAFAKSCANIRSPWLLQSGGKDSTQLAIIAAEVRPDTTCITYLGGSEENEVESASYVAKELGLRHETLACDPGRAYDRYVALVPKMPLLTADFALLSYVDLATDIAANGGDGIVDGMGADNYFGIPVGAQHRWISRLARGIRLPGQMCEWPLIGHSFELCYLLSTLQMDQIERDFPGSRFTDAEVDDLFGRNIAERSHARLELFQQAFATADSDDERVAMAITVAGATGGFAKGMYTASALSLQSAYPFCDPDLREWVYRQVPSDQLVDPVTRTSKVLMRKHIATRFRNLPYVARKGSFRFNVCGLAKARFDQVHACALRGRDILPGAAPWLERNRRRLDNKYHASKFYLLAVVLPWIDRLLPLDRKSH
jgi:asparagine synthetase B (glutamine-hydrolysing)